MFNQGSKMLLIELRDTLCVLVVGRGWLEGFLAL
jgi:hypothetical protein